MYRIALLLLLSVTAGAQAPVVVRSTEPAAWGAAPRLVKEISIGGVEGDERYMFSSVNNVAVGANGSIVVADDGQKPVVRLYDATGKFAKNIGRDGEGPGEYRGIGAVRTFRDGRIALWDDRMQRLNVFTADGKLIANARVPSGLHTSDIMHVDHSGQAFVQTVVKIDRIASRLEFGWVRVSPALKVLDTIVSIANPHPKSFVIPTPSGFDRPFSRDVISTVTATGALLSGDNAQYAFELRKRGAATLRVERAFTPVAVVGRERDEWKAWAEYMFQVARSNPSPNSIRAPSLATIPANKPAFLDLSSDSDGRIWVRRYVTAVTRPAVAKKSSDKRPARTQLEPPTYDVFEPTGKFLGTIVLPWDAFFEDAVGMKLYVTQTGDDGDITVVRYRIEISK